jgi:hypothetical protein
MPNVTRALATDDLALLQVLAGSASGPTPAPLPARALASEARRVLISIADPRRRPAHWSHPTFGRQVDAVRRHLAPVRSRSTLAACYGREAFHVIATPAERDDPGPIRIAYALRWLELRDGTVGPAWPAMIESHV